MGTVFSFTKLKNLFSKVLMPQLEFEFFWHQYFWTSVVFLFLLYVISETYLINIIVARAFRVVLVQFMECYEEFTTIDPITRGYVVGPVYLSFFYSNYKLTKDFYKLFVSYNSISELRYPTAVLKFYNTRRQFEFYVYNTHDDFENYYRFFKKNERVNTLILFKET